MRGNTGDFFHWRASCIIQSMNAQNQQSNRPRILFVDDSKLMRVTASKILGKSFDLVTAEDGSQAWEMLNQDPTIQAVFSDLNMPNMDGYSLLGNIRSAGSDRLKEMPVVMLTSSEEHERARKAAMEQGASDFLGKPFQATELIARARTHASFKEATRRIRSLEKGSHTDQATGLGNYRFCSDRLEQALSFARRHNQPLNIVHLQIDVLAEADNTLARDLAGILTATIRDEDVACRTSSSTFTLILPATGTDGANRLWQRIEPQLNRLGISAGTLFQEPALDPNRDAATILQDGLAELTPPCPAEGTDKRSESAPDLEEALAMLARGETSQAEAHLPELLERIQPLLDLQKRLKDRDYRPSRLMAFAEAGNR